MSLRSTLRGAVNFSVGWLPGPAMAGYERSMKTRPEARYAGYLYPTEIIATAVWLYSGFP